ncbi:hypothetical protein VTN02DRAFT_3333 [Thermoascus thermophilus]
MPRGQARSRSRSPDPFNQARGYKATLSNPHVSEPAKQRAKKILEEQYEGGGEGGGQSSSDEEIQTTRASNNRARGLKAAIRNRNVSERGKQQAREQLEEMNR